MGKKVFIFFFNTEFPMSGILQKKKKVIYFIPKTPYDREKNSYSTYIFIKGFLGHFLLVILYPLSKTKKNGKWPTGQKSVAWTFTSLSMLRASF